MTFNKYHNKLVAIAENNPFFSVTDKTLTITEKNNIVTIDLNSISNLRILKYRELLVNYLLVTFILLLNRAFYDSIDNNFISHSIVNVITFVAIMISFTFKRYSHFVLINRIGLNFNKYKIVISKTKTNQDFVVTLKNYLNYFSGKNLSGI